MPLLKLAMEDSVTNTMSTKYFPFTREPKGYADSGSGSKGGGFFKSTGVGSSATNLATAVPMLNGAPINSTGTNPYSLRTQRANWASGAKKKANNALQLGGGEDGDGLSASSPLSKATGVDAGISESVLLNECRKNGPRLMVFVIGGITYSEIRSCYEIMREWRREVIIGNVGSCVITILHHHI